MARRVNLATELGKKKAEPVTTTEPEETAPAPKKRTPSARKTSASQKPAARGSGSQKAEKAPAKAASTGTSTRSEPIVKGVPVAEAKRVSLYLSEDDYEWAKYELRGGDLQAVIRTMFAVIRNSPRLTDQVEKLSRTAPRGGH